MPESPRGSVLGSAARLPIAVVFAIYVVILAGAFVWGGQDLLFRDAQNATGTHTAPANVEVGQAVTVNSMSFAEGWSLVDDPEAGKPTIEGLVVTNEHGNGLFVPGDRELLVDIYFYEGDRVVYEILCNSDGEVAPGDSAELDCTPYLYDWPESYERIEFVSISR